MKLFDQHLHSKFSMDCESDPADVVRHAIEVGLDGLTFTEHFDTHPSERDGCIYDDAAYSAAIRQLREQFAGRIRVGKGVEVDYQPDSMSEILDFLAGHEFDLVILSVHWMFDKPIHARETWVDVDPSQTTRRYLEAVRVAVEHCRELNAGPTRSFDVLGHLDFVKRYSHRYAGGIFVDRHEDVLREIVAGCVAANLVPEINTSTLRQGYEEAMPGPGVVHMYAEAGGRMMSLGSDAHSPDVVGADFDTALGYLRRAGIQQLAVFENRARRGEPIDGA